MYPLPIIGHLSNCSCPAVRDPCHLWIHKSGGPGQVIAFPSVEAAYLYGEYYILSTAATPFNGGNEPWEKIIWQSEDEAWWWVEGGIRGDSLCQITADMADGAGCGGKVAGDGRHHWLFFGTPTEQLLIGLGSDLPPLAQLTTCPYGYTLEDSAEVRQAPPHTSCGSWRCPYTQEQEQAPASLDLSGCRDSSASAPAPSVADGSGTGADACAAEARILRTRRAVAAVREAFLHGSLGDPVPASATAASAAHVSAAAASAAHVSAAHVSAAHVSAAHVSATEPVDFEGVE